MNKWQYSKFLVNKTHHWKLYHTTIINSGNIRKSYKINKLPGYQVGLLGYNSVLITKLFRLHKIGVPKCINMASSTFKWNDERALLTILKHLSEYILAYLGFSIRWRPVAESKYVGNLLVLKFCGRCFKVLHFLVSQFLFKEALHVRIYWYVDFQVKTDGERVLLFTTNNQQSHFKGLSLISKL